MALSATNAEVGNIIEIPVESVEIGERVGMFWADKALQIGAAIAADGQNDPIKVRRAGPKAAKPWVLVAGLHRLQGSIAVYLPTIQAIVVQGDQEALRLIEVSENLHRRDFEPLERAMFVRALADIYERRFYEGCEGLSVHQVGQLNRWKALRDNLTTRDEVKADIEAELLEEGYSPDIVSGLSGWQGQLISNEPVSARILRDCLFIHRTIIAPFDRALIAKLAVHPEGRSRKSLMEIGKVATLDQRRAIIEWLASRPGATLGQAIDELGEKRAAKAPPADGQEKYRSNALSNLERLSSRSWRDIAPDVVRAIKPGALGAFRDAINARLAEIGTETGGVDE